MLTLIIAACTGGVCGAVIRYKTPYLIHKTDKSKPFSWPWLELSAAFSFATIVNHSNSYGTWVLSAIFTIVLLALSSTDFLCKLIPQKFTIISTLSGILLTALFPSDILIFQDQGLLLQFFSASSQLAPTSQAVILSSSGALLGFTALELMRRIMGSATNMEVMGMGDSLILMLIGAFIGPKMVLLSILPASIIGVTIGLYFKWVKGSPHSPFGPALALGGWLQFLYWRQLDQGINGFYGFLYALPPWVMGAFTFFLLIVLFLLLLRIKKKAAEYERMITEDYESIEKELED